MGLFGFKIIRQRGETAQEPGGDFESTVALALEDLDKRLDTLAKAHNTLRMKVYREPEDPEGSNGQPQEPKTMSLMDAYQRRQ